MRIYSLNNLTEEELATVMAKCARSPEPFDEIAKTVNVEGAEQFHEKYVLGYGHNSVAEIAVPNFVFENVSIFASKILESMPRGAYQERSTRVQNFSEVKDGRHVNYYIPTWLKGEALDLYIESQELLFNTYDSILPKLQSYIKEELGVDNFTARKRAFDSARYILPIGTLTNLGMRINGRDCSTLISKLLSSSIPEFNHIGHSLQEEATKQLPTLVRHADKNDFLMYKDKMCEDFRTILRMENEYNLNNHFRTIFKDDKEEHAIMVIAKLFLMNQGYGLWGVTNDDYDFDESQARLLIDLIMSHRGEHDPFPDEFDYLRILTDLVVDYGAFRDLQRHRFCTQYPQLPSRWMGYETPKDIKSCGVEGGYISAIATAHRNMDKIQNMCGDEDHAHLYMIPLAYRHRTFIEMSFKQAAYIIELRSKPQGHISYRLSVKDLYDCLKKEYPFLSKWIRCHSMTLD